MLPLERHRLIVELLGQRGVMRVNEIAQATRVSRETIRRDLSELERKGILNRSHGGALAAENPLPTTRAAALAAGLTRTAAWSITWWDRSGAPRRVWVRMRRVTKCARRTSSH